VKPRVLITRQMPEEALAVVRDVCELQYDPSDRQLTQMSSCREWPVWTACYVW
jgi:hypothetical protein